MYNFFSKSFVFFLALMLSASLFAVDVKDIRVAQQDGLTRLVIELSEAAEHRLFSLSNPDRVVLDISDASLSDAKLLEINNMSSGVLQKVRYAKREAGARFVLDLSRKVKSKSIVLSSSSAYGPRIMVELEYSDTPKTPLAIKSLDAFSQSKRDIVVVIDAGHGGKDPGALGKFKVREKDVVLSIAKELAKKLGEEKGFKPVLTRSTDVYLKLRDRSQIARDANADLFISIHADAFTHASARGASVWALSLGGKTSEMGRWLAQQEQSSELVGGISLDDKDQLLAEVLLDMSMNSTIQFSLDIGSDVLSEMDTVAKLHKNAVQQAGFVVLKSPDIPSILIETGFVSNETEAKNLASSRYRKQLADAIAKGVVDAFQKNPPEGSYIAWQKQSLRNGVYTVASGDTLSEIAKRNNVSIEHLRSANSLKNDVIRIGQKLTIPSS